MPHRISRPEEECGEIFTPYRVSDGDGSFLSQATAWVLVFVLSCAALLWLGILGLAVSVIDEGIFHSLSSRYESEPAQGWDAARAEVVREALPSWIGGGAIWLGVMLFLLWLVWRCGLRAIGVRPGIPY
ncbi:hypothetical protein [Haloferula sp. BvORR071]|uniref:hypothetical protein n=1 Tax=Haloferula sp. BvORR071 TaxID=1396141 RepID=UPI000551E0D5|nr:hypothetical protein [Haloferula sp. BvORR071]